MPRIRTLLVALLLATPLTAVANGLTVTVNPWGPVTTVEFDPGKAPGTPADPDKPGDLPGPPVDDNGKSLIVPGEAAVAVAATDTTQSSFQGTVDGAGRVTITAVDVKISGATTIYVPTNADQQLKDHETGHDTLAKYEYDTNAARKLREAMGALAGRTFENAPAAKAAYEAAIERAAETVDRQIRLIGEKYDGLTNHGRNDQVDPKTGKAVDTPAGVAMTEQEWQNAPAAGERPGKPDPDQPQGSTAPHAAAVTYDAASGELAFVGDRFLRQATTAPDSILGLGIFEVGNLLPVGVAANGSVHLADTTFRIVDAQSGTVLLDGFLLEVAWLASTLPGYASMIQGHVDIVPTFAGGIDNTIQSGLLRALADATARNDPTTFWFYSDQPVFDTGGNVILSAAGSSGDLRIGTALPEPGTAALVLTALVAALARLAGRRSRDRAAGRGPVSFAQGGVASVQGQSRPVPAHGRTRLARMAHGTGARGGVRAGHAHVPDWRSPRHGIGAGRHRPRLVPGRSRRRHSWW